jgi:5-methylcytosine-specific restriction endonuclease McrA
MLSRKVPLKHKTHLAPVGKKRRKRNGKPGKCGIVRLYGKNLEALRETCFERDRRRCVDCGRRLVLERGFVDSMQMAHVRTKRNNGDTLDNVRSKCGDCHHREHNPKAVPPKGN